MPSPSVLRVAALAAGHAALRAALLVAGPLAGQAAAEVPRFLHVEGFGHLLEGSAETTTLSDEGAIGLRPQVHERFADPAFAAGAAATWNADVVLARLDGEPQLVAVGNSGKTRTLLPLGERLVTKLVGTKAGLYVATTGKDGARLQRLDAAGGVHPVAFGEARFVWDVVPLADGGLLLATGEPGAVVYVDKAGKGRTVFAAGEAHLKALACDAKLGTFVGGGERGVLYHGDTWQAYAQGRGAPFRALHDSRHTEITALVSNGNHVFAAAVSGQLAPAASEGEGGGRHAKVPNEVRSVLLRVDVDGAVDTLAASTEELIYDLAQDATGQVLVATGAASKGDPRGRLYRFEPTRQVVSLVYQAPSRRLIQLLARPGEGPIVVAQDGTRLLELSDAVDETGTYLTAPLDTGVTSRFGLVQALGDFPPGSRGELAVRTGQTREPDSSWSQWSAAVAAPGNRPVQVPNGRYAQLRLTLHGRQKAQPQVYRLRLTYLRQNLPPFIREVVALEKGTILLPLPQASSSDEARSKITSVAEKVDEPGAAVSRPPPRVRQVAERGAMTLKWVVDEPNGDELIYTLWQRAAGGGDWQLVQDKLRDPFYTFHSAQLADGHYTFRVKASDAPSNPAALAREDVRDSRAILVDNTPPSFAKLTAKVKGSSVQLRGEISDALSPLVALTYALDGAELRPLAPEDGLVDGLHERFVLPLDNLAPGGHAVTFRARDEADNEGYGELHFDVAPQR